MLFGTRAGDDGVDAGMEAVGKHFAQTEDGIGMEVQVGKGGNDGFERTGRGAEGVFVRGELVDGLDMWGGVGCWKGRVAGAWDLVRA